MTKKKAPPAPPEPDPKRVEAGHRAAEVRARRKDYVDIKVAAYTSVNRKAPTKKLIDEWTAKAKEVVDPSNS